MTVGSLLFGIAWSYRQHGPSSARVKAERAYRRHLRRLARKRVRLAQLERRAKKAGVMAAIVIAVTISYARPGEATDCTGPVVLALIDTTTAYDDVDRGLIMPAIERMAGIFAARTASCHSNRAPCPRGKPALARCLHAASTKDAMDRRRHLVLAHHQSQHAGRRTRDIFC